MDKRNNIKIGIMGGTFNPIHMGHLMLAQTALTQYQLDKIWFMPNGMPAYKSMENIIQNEHRMEMVRLAIEENEQFELSSFEIDREGYTYTYETMELLKKQYPNAEFYFIIGGDSLFAFSKWKYPERIVKNCVLLAAPRNGITAEELDTQIKLIRESYQAEVYPLHCPNVDISSDMLRQRLMEQESIRYYVPEKVYAYITENKLYHL